MNDQRTLPTPTLDDDRVAQLRTFFTVEAAADAAVGDARTRSAQRGRRRLALGLVATVLLTGGLLASTAIIGTPGATPADAVAIEEADGWINVRLVDVDADPDAVVEQLRGAGIDARVATADEAGLVGGTTGDAGITSLSVEASDGTGLGVGMVSVRPDAAAPLEVEAGIDPEDPSITAPAVTTVEDVDDTGTSTGRAASTAVTGGSGEGVPYPQEALDAELDAAGVRFEADGSISLRSGADLTVLVFTTA